VGGAFLSMDLNYRQRSQNKDEFIFLIHPTLEKVTHPNHPKRKQYTILSGMEPYLFMKL
jgi:hypothetical protein